MLAGCCLALGADLRRCMAGVGWSFRYDGLAWLATLAAARHP